MDSQTPPVHPSASRVAVIGSGFGGLAAAIRLQAAGLPVTLFEARDKPGGRAYVYDVGEFHFDGGPTVITAPECIDELFTLAGRSRQEYVELLPVQPFYRLIWSDGRRFDYTNDAAQMERQIAAFSPRDVAGYARFLEYSRKVFDKGYTELAATPFLRFSDMARVAPDLIRLRADRSVYSAVSKFIEEPHLREAFSFHSLLVGGNPFDTSAIYTLIHFLERNWGVHFPKGGTGALVSALVRLFEELGGELRLSCKVTSIAVEDGPHHRHLVTSSFMEREAFTAVVSNADVQHTYRHLYASHPRAERRAKRVEKMDWSMSLFVLYFGTDRPYDNLAHHTVLFGPRYRGLLDDIFRGNGLADDFSLYLHAPCASDPSMAPPGKGAFYVLSPVPHLGTAPLDWQAIAPTYAQRILTSLEREMPNLRQHVVAQHWITPQDFARDLGAFQGSAFSVAPKLTQSAWFRPHNQDSQIPGLYLVGAGTHPGAGLPGVINSAKATAGLVLSDLGSTERAAPRANLTLGAQGTAT